MAKIEGFRVKNYGVLSDLTLGKLWNLPKVRPLTPMTAVIGKNGVGKSTLFDAFGFLADCLRLGVEKACDARGRGGFERIHSGGREGPIEIAVYYKEDGNARPITYELAIDLDHGGRPFVLHERLRQRRRGQKHRRPFSFLVLKGGKGIAWKGEEAGAQLEDEGDQSWSDVLDATGKLQGEESRDTEAVELEDPRRLGIATVGTLRQHPRIAAFRRFIEGWYLSYFTPDTARGLPLAGPQRHLNIHSDNLGNVVQYMEREHPKRFRTILERIAHKTPGSAPSTRKRPSTTVWSCASATRDFQTPFMPSRCRTVPSRSLPICCCLKTRSHPLSWAPLGWTLVQRLFGSKVSGPEVMHALRDPSRRPVGSTYARSPCAPYHRAEAHLRSTPIGESAGSRRGSRAHRIPRSGSCSTTCHAYSVDTEILLPHTHPVTVQR